MNRRADPFVYLPFAIPGLLVGGVLSVLVGWSILDRWPSRDAEHGQVTSGQVQVEGTVEWAGWRRSARGGGPTWFLQIRLAEDPRGFLVAASDLTADATRQLSAFGEKRNQKRLPLLEGKRAVIGVDAGYRQASRSATPYMQVLRVGETIVVSAAASTDAASAWPRTIVFVLLGTGLLVGLGLTAVSLHHLIVCARYGRAA